jgi:hypothetical protein
MKPYRGPPMTLGTGTTTNLSISGGISQTAKAVKAWRKPTAEF